jgi:hypothetical protein
MQGYRTIIFNAAVTLAAGGTVQFSDLPPDVQHWLTLAVMAWGMIGIVFRLITETPIGQKAEATVERDLGLTPDQLAQIVQAVLHAVRNTVETMPVAVVPAPAIPARPPDTAA